MSEVLAARVSRLKRVGWELKSQSDTSVALEARRPFNRQLFALMFVLFPIFGGLIYIAIWALTPSAQLRLDERNGEVVTSQGTPLGSKCDVDLELARRLEADLRPRGRFASIGSALLAMTLVVLVWFFVAWSLAQSTL